MSPRAVLGAAMVIAASACGADDPAAQPAPIPTAPSVPGDSPGDLPAVAPEPRPDEGVRVLVDGGPGGAPPDACYAEIDALGVKTSRVAARGVVGALRLEGPVNGVVFASGAAKEPMKDPVACAFVKTLWSFAELVRERGFVRVGTLGSYCYRCCCAWSTTNQCRAAADPEPTCPDGYSNHSWGRALDVRWLTREDGTTLDVKSETDWVKSATGDTCGAGLAAQTGKSRELYDLTCTAAARRVFGTVLTPNYNAAHRDHLHMDIGASGTPSTQTVRGLDTAALPAVDTAPADRCDE